MKFVPIASAKNLKVGEPVYTLNKSGEYNTGKLISRIEDDKGTHRKFEIPQYFDSKSAAVEPVYVENITHVCLMKDRKNNSDDSQE